VGGQRAVSTGLTYDVPDSGLFADADPILMQRFRAFHSLNPLVFIVFVEYAREMQRAGKTKYGAWSIIAKVRWDMDIATQSNELFQINNDFIALYARLAIHHFQEEFGGFFELRSLKPNRQMSEEERRRRREQDG